MTFTSVPAPLAEELMPDVPAPPVPETSSDTGSDNFKAEGVTPTIVGKTDTFVPLPIPCWALVALARCEAHMRSNSTALEGEALGFRKVCCGSATTVWLSPERAYSRAMFSCSYLWRFNRRW